MRWKQKTALFPGLISSFLLAFFYLHLFRDLFPEHSPSPPPAPDTAPFSHPLKQPRDHRHNLAIHEHLAIPPPVVTESVLLPYWEVLLLLPSLTSGDHNHLSCLFPNGATSAARYSGRIPSSAHAAFLCSLPPSVRRLRPFYSPRLIGSNGITIDGSGRPPEMIRWNRLAYESFSTETDVIVFAKGVNNRQGINRPAAHLRCVFLVDGVTVSVTAVTSSAQEVFRCPHPSATDLRSRTAGGGRDIRISLEIAGEKGAIPSLATYKAPTRGSVKGGKSLICACTMVYNVAKFLREWITYHSSIGVERFILYDNGSEDELDSKVTRLRDEGCDVSTRYWPWPKTQEAGFSHCAAAHRNTCEWMAFLDVDEFVFSPSWTASIQPNRTMLGSIILTEPENIGQVSISCLDFGPSGQRAHPKFGVMQGYTCRIKRKERHKSIVKLDSVSDSLVNTVHHFGLGEGWVTNWVSEAVVNHYKYQAWEEFKLKFRRRVSAYVADWRQAVNPGSKDRTPGLGFEPVEPKGWAWRFCEVNDMRVREVTQRWFGVVGPNGKLSMVWNE